MDKMTIKEMEKEIERCVEGMSEHQRDHLRALIYEFVKCYDKDSKDCALVILGNDQSLNNIISVNCDTMEAANLMQAADNFLGCLNTRDAPPKEMFN